MNKKKKFVIGFFVLGIVLLISAVLYFAVPQSVIGNQPTLDSCRSYIKYVCSGGGYTCSDCSMITLPYSVKFDDGTVTNKVYSADCVYGSSSDTGIGLTGLPKTYCSNPNVITSHSYYQCYGNDVYWYNSASVREGVKSSCSYRCSDDSLTTASCVTAPSCQSQSLSCGTPSLPDCCSGLSCQNFQCMPSTAGYNIVNYKCVAVSSGATYSTLTKCTNALNVPVCMSAGAVIPNYGQALSNQFACSKGTPSLCQGTLTNCFDSTKTCKDGVCVSPSCDASLGASCSVKGQDSCDANTLSTTNCQLKSDNCLHLVSSKCVAGTSNQLCLSCFPQLAPVNPPVTCKMNCAGTGLTQCTSPNAFSQCVADANGCLDWNQPQFCPTGKTCSDGKCVTPAVVNVPLPKCLDASFICMANPQTYNGELVSCDGYKCQYGCVDTKCNPAPVPPPSCAVSSICSSSSNVLTTNSDCTTKTLTCGSGQYCNGGSCVPIILEPVTDLCKDVTCQDSCSATHTYQSQGSCNNGQCVYSSIQVMSPNCLSPVTNVTNNFTNSITGDVIIDGGDGGNNSFISRYGIWIAGGVFILSLLLFIVQFGGKKKRGRK